MMKFPSIPLLPFCLPGFRPLIPFPSALRLLAVPLVPFFMAVVADFVFQAFFGEDLAPHRPLALSPLSPERVSFFFLATPCSPTPVPDNDARRLLLRGTRRFFFCDRKRPGLDCLVLSPGIFQNASAFSDLFHPPHGRGGDLT